MRYPNTAAMYRRWLIPLALSAVVLTSACHKNSAPEAPEPDTTPAPLDAQAQNAWVKQRIQALVTMYNISPAGRAWLEGYDLRQIVGRPGWFGSFGNEGWAGVGQAIPSSVLHEVSHSYYGAFPITGFDELSWQRGPTGDLSPGRKQYRLDLVTFMIQPPDSYEALRDRFRNLPHLSRNNDPDLFHFGEADLLLTTGGNLQLIPPILRKYFDQFLGEGRFESWEEALTWYLGLPSDEQMLANAYIGIGNIPTRKYKDLKPSKQTHLATNIRETLAAEERQRLVDFALQFEAIKANELGLRDAANVDRSFQFWRGYLQDMLGLHKKHPEVARSTGESGPRSAEALSSLAGAEELHRKKQVDLLRQWLRDPFMASFVVVLPNSVLIDLFRGSGLEPFIETGAGAIDGFVARLATYSVKVDELLSTGRESIQRGATDLVAFVEGQSDTEQEKFLGLMFDLMKDNDRITARNLVDRVSDEVILRMLRNNPGALRNGNISHERLLKALSVTPHDTPTAIVDGLKTMFKHSSGNFQIDGPVTSLAFRVIADVAEKDPGAALETLRDAEVPLADFIRALPEESARLLSSDLPEAARILADPKGYAYAPQHTVHQLIQADAALAARVVEELERQGRDDLVVESVIVFAFDAIRIQSTPSAALSLEADGEFLLQLAELKGADWLTDRMAAAIGKYQREVAQHQIDATFIDEYRATLLEIVNREEKNGDSEGLRRIIDEALVESGLAPLVTE